jgi:membrane associated rhomboid family serine protease
MIVGRCDCGVPFSLAESTVNRPAACKRCGRILHPIAGELPEPGAGAGDFDTRLLVLEGRDQVGDSFFLGGRADIEIGKLPGKPIMLATAKVSRLHAKLVRVGFAPSRWKVEDCNSTNGVYVNGAKTESHDLREGDVVRFGEYQMRFTAVSKEDLPVVAPAEGASAAAEGTPVVPPPLQPPRTQTADEIAMGWQLSVTRIRKDNSVGPVGWIRRKSRVVPVGVFPLPVEIAGRRPPYATWIIAAMTLICSLWFLISTMNVEAPNTQAMNLMLWSGTRNSTVAPAEPAARRSAAARGMTVAAAPVPVRPPSDEADDEAISSLPINQLTGGVGSGDILAGDAAGLAPAVVEKIGFQRYQLLTHVVLNRSVFQLVVNLLFLFLIAMRLNEVLGNIKMGLVCFALIVASAGIELFVRAHESLRPSIGASGVLTALAGMYFLLFPVQRIPIAMWMNIGLFTGNKCAYKIFTIRGFWLVAFWFVFNDVLPSLRHALPQRIHTAHAVDFALGAAVALALLILRQVNSGGNDLLSVVLGRRAWALIGRPGGNAARDSKGAATEEIRPVPTASAT